MRRVYEGKIIVWCVDGRDDEVPGKESDSGGDKVIKVPGIRRVKFINVDGVGKPRRCVLPEFI